LNDGQNDLYIERAIKADVSRRPIDLISAGRLTRFCIRLTARENIVVRRVS
jgi:hypothetical protein